MKRFILISAIALSGCVSTVEATSKPSAMTNQEVQTVQQAMAHSNKDPESTKFREMRAYQLSSGGRAICGQMNAKNSFGAYVGYSPFYLRIDQGEPKSLQIDTLANVACNQAASGKINLAAPSP